MAVSHINRAINALDRIPTASEVPRGFKMEVCAASQAEWNAFVESENQALRSKHMEWINGRIVIVEFPGGGHDEFARALNRFIQRIPNTEDCLAAHGATYWKDGPHYEPDESYGPMRQFAEPRGVQLPAGIRKWSEFATLKVEVGLSRAWGLTAGNLDWKALHAWQRVPGIAYVLCVAVEEDLRSANYKLYELPTDNLINPPTEIQANTPPVRLDARRLLALPPLPVPLPAQFPNPVLIDLWAVLQRARLEAGV